MRSTDLLSFASGVFKLRAAALLRDFILARVLQEETRVSDEKIDQLSSSGFIGFNLGFGLYGLKEDLSRINGSTVLSIPALLR